MIISSQKQHNVDRAVAVLQGEGCLPLALCVRWGRRRTGNGEWPRWEDEEKGAQDLCFTAQLWERQGGNGGLLQSGRTPQLEKCIKEWGTPQEMSLENKLDLRDFWTCRDGFLYKSLTFTRSL